MKAELVNPNTINVYVATQFALENKSHVTSTTLYTM